MPPPKWFQIQRRHNQYFVCHEDFFFLDLQSQYHRQHCYFLVVPIICSVVVNFCFSIKIFEKFLEIKNWCLSPSNLQTEKEVSAAVQLNLESKQRYHKLWCDCNDFFLKNAQLFNKTSCCIATKSRLTFLFSARFFLSKNETFRIF